jgi:hypothetical protein
METATVCIGNTDNKLTQQEWSDFCGSVSADVGMFATEVFFKGFSNPDSMYQNACWVFSILPNRISGLQANLKHVRSVYKQDSVAFVIGSTEFI